MAGIDRGGGIVVKTPIRNLEFIQKVISADLLFQPSRTVFRAPGVENRIDIERILAGASCTGLYVVISCVIHGVSS